jgi:regulatory protein
VPIRNAAIQSGTELRTMKMDSEEIDEIAYLIGSNFLNEERFAVLPEENTASSNGESRITNELKFRKINARLISTALKEITQKNMKKPEPS